MYDELVKSLRQCAEASCAGCKNDLIQIGCRGMIQHEAADAIEELQQVAEHYRGCMNEWFEAAQEYKAAVPRWIPVTERLPEVEKDVLVAFPHNQAVAYILDDGRWEVVSGDGWSTDINIADGEKIPTHWMPLPQPPKEVDT